MAKSNVVDMSSFGSELSSILSMYSKNVSDETQNWVEKTAKLTSKQVKKNARKASFKTRTVGKKYIDGWTATKEGAKWVVHNKTQYRLAHLLENGHAIVRNGVVVGHSPAFPHIKPAEKDMENMVSELEDRLKKVEV